MPVEVRQLVIRATVIDDAEARGARAASGPEGATASAASPGKDRERLVAECVEEVMAILREQRER